ncbi:uncharacterized protein J8A68_001617 [[Candida] subhashii]|uniref:RBR-type E3 ubiquitin transferase n=1 Tax=[Candida] subhashii TaxID=561895 RepID=A0A8J5QFU1_9ASCO|nr:uncharacterized protein J8A68_001617 [[Candida] subhashii]KAG7664859.1 hypothetical protein J8A68_001617 [[Candida] subhashii]
MNPHYKLIEQPFQLSKISNDKMTTHDITPMEHHMDEEFSDDIRIQELQSCKLIYPDSKINYTNFQGSIDIPIKLEKDTELRLFQSGPSAGTKVLVATSVIINLKPIRLEFQLSESYPYEAAPEIQISSTSLQDKQIDDLQDHLNSIWPDYRDQVLFHLIDYIQDQTQNNLPELFGTTIDIVDDFDKYYQLLDYDKHIKQAEFDETTYSCEICQTDYKGKQCQKFDECGHVFCNNCLYEFFSSSITLGEIDKVHCPNFECTKKFQKSREDFMKLETWTFNDKKVKDIVGNLLQPPMPIHILTSILQTKLPAHEASELVKRYISLHKKAQFEVVGRLLPDRLVKCPRIGCDEAVFREDLSERLVVCPKCRYAFCNDCRKSYHARFKLCHKISGDEKYSGIPVEDLEKYNLLPQDSYEKKTLNAKYGRNRILHAIDEFNMDKLFEQMLKESMDVKECPNCGVVIEKTDGCNKMKCSECNTSFCFLCGDRIPNNYDHFTEPGTSCYRLLFFGMPGVD